MNNFFLIISLSLICFIFIVNEKLSAQFQADSLWNEHEAESDIYEINLIKFKRLLLKKQINIADSIFKNQLSSLSNQFTELAANKKYFNANIILESTINILSNWSSELTIDEELLNLDFDSDATIEKQAGFEWTKEVSFGSDQWRQEFEMSIPGYDSTITEEAGNPFVQFRMGLNYDHSNYSFNLDGNFKNSRDYLAGEMDFNFKNKLSENTNWTIENRFESTNYKQSMDLSYWQNEVAAELNMKNSGRFSMSLEDKFLIRKNSPESSSYTDYFQNRFTVDGNYSGGIHFLIGGDYEWESRLYPVYSQKDYQEHQFGLNYYGMFSFKYNIHLDIKYRHRNYNAVYNDTTFYNDYDEIYSNFSSTYRLNDRLALKLENTTESRNYTRVNQVTIDYLDFELKPALVFYPKEFWTIELGYVYSSRNYKQPDADKIQIIDDDGTVTEILYEENYFSNGISLAFDIFKINKFMFSITNIFSMKRYPQSATNDISNFTLYTDRNTNSLLCYFSWSITKNWELGLIANYDTDQNPHQENSDARNTMFSAELTYLF